MTKYHYDQRRFFEKLCRDERNEEYTGEDESSSDALPSGDDDKSTTSTYKRAREVARQRLEEKQESDTCLCKEADLASKMTRDFRIANTCEECGHNICKNCFGRIIWVFKKLPPKGHGKLKKDKRVYIQECLCTSDLPDYRYKSVLMKYQRRMCYNCFIDIPVDHYVYFGMQHAKKSNVDFMKKYLPITDRKSLIERTSSMLEGRRTSSQIGSSRRNSSLMKSSIFDNRESMTSSLLPGEDAETEQGGGRRSFTEKGERRLSINTHRLSVEQNGRHKSTGNSERRLSTNAKKENKVKDNPSPVTTVLREKNQSMSPSDKQPLSSNAKKGKRVTVMLGSGPESAMEKVRRPLKENGKPTSILKKRSLKY